MKLSKEDAFLACGLDSGTAKTLTSANFTPAKLRKASDAKLAKFGLEGDAKSRIKRPPIPPATVFSVLDKSRRTCCVCQTPGRSIIIHHIREWHKSRSHAEEDLAVLCLNDHGEAHTQRKLGQNLTPNQIRLHKKNWEKRVQEASGRALVGLSRVQGANWDYINHARLFRLSDQLKVKVTSVAEFRIARGLCMISKHGEVNDPSKWQTGSRPSGYLYQAGEGRHLYAYTSALLETVIQRLGATDISTLTRGQAEALIENGALVFFQGPVYFRRENRKHSGVGQLRRAYTKGVGVELDFSFDAWECTSSSSWAVRLSGRKVDLPPRN